jgi:hypothetical protein
VIVPLTVAPADGAVIFTTGGLESGAERAPIAIGPVPHIVASTTTATIPTIARTRTEDRRCPLE